MKKKKMTKEKAIEIIEYLNGSFAVQFSSYYKYTFTFKGQNDRYEIIVSLGGNSEDIYRLEVQSETNYMIPETWEKMAEWYHSIYIEDKETGEIYQDYWY